MKTQDSFRHAKVNSEKLKLNLIFSCFQHWFIFWWLSKHINKIWIYYFPQFAKVVPRNFTISFGTRKWVSPKRFSRKSNNNRMTYRVRSCIMDHSCSLLLYSWGCVHWALSLSVCSHLVPCLLWWCSFLHSWMAERGRRSNSVIIEGNVTQKIS